MVYAHDPVEGKVRQHGLRASHSGADSRVNFTHNRQFIHGERLLSMRREPVPEPEECGILEELFGSVDEYADTKAPLFEKKSLYTGELIPPESKHYTSGVNLFSYQAKVIKELAQRESCVIIGRCANLILDPEHFPNVLRVYVHAPWDARMESACRKKGGSRKDVARFMRRDDKRKEELCRRYTGKDWNDPAYYDLYLDTSEMGRDQVQDVIEKAYLEMKMKAANR